MLSLPDFARLLPSLGGVVGVAAGLLWGCGFLVARPLLPRRYRAVLPLVAPFLGFSLISAVAHYAGAAGAALRSVLWLFVVLAAAGWLLVVLDRRARRFPRSSAPALAICLLAFLLAVLPLLMLGYLTTLGATIDGISYAVRSEYLQHATLRAPEIEAGKPYLGWVRSQIELFRAGDVYFVGVLGLLTDRRSYELLSVVPALFFGLMPGAVYVLARIALGLRRQAALLAAVLVGINNLLLWPVVDNFLSQVIALSFLPVVLAVGIEAQRRPTFRIAALFALLWTGLMTVYPIYAARTLAALLVFWGLSWLLDRCGLRLHALRRAALWWLGTLALAVLWNGVGLRRGAIELAYLSSALTDRAVESQGRGNILVFPPVVEVLGLVSHAAAAYGEGWKRVPMPILNAIGLGFALLAAYGWWRLAPRARLATAALLLTGAALAAQQRWGAHYPYGYFKMISTVVAEVMLLVAAGIAALGQDRRPALRWLAGGAALLLVGVNLKHSLWTQSQVRTGALVLDQDLIDIGRAASGVDPEAWVLLDLKPGLRQHWLGYLIRERRIRYREPLWTLQVDTPGAANAHCGYAVVDKELAALRRRTVLDEPWYEPATYRRLAGNRRFELRERGDPVLASFEWHRRWPSGSALELAFAPSGAVLSAHLAGDFMEREIDGDARTLQVRVYSLDPASAVAVAPSGAAINLDTGGWLVDVDLGCIADRRFRINHAAGDIVLSDIRVLSADTGRAEDCVETARLETGAAYLEQDDLGGGRVRLRASVVRPQSAGRRRYRLGLHIVEESRAQLFGVWSLDFPADALVQHGSLELDLRDRSSQAEIEGRAVAPLVSNFDTGAGLFRVDAVWWQLDPVDQLRIEPMFRFEREADGTVPRTRAVPEPRLTVLRVP